MHLRTLSVDDKRLPALALMRSVLAAPQFPADVLAREKARTIAGLKEAAIRPEVIAARTFWRLLYPGHPYGRDVTPESVVSIGRDDLVEFHRQHYTAANASVTLVGDLSRAQAQALAEELTAGLPAGGAAPPGAPPVVPLTAPVEERVAHAAAQAHVLIGLPALKRGDPDFFALQVGNYTLGGGGFVSRLMKEVRDKRGYAYSVYSYFAPLRHSGPFQIGLQTKRSQANDAITVARDVLDTFLQEGPSEEELAAAKANLTGSFPLRLDSNRKILDNVAVIGFFGLPLDYLDHYQAKVQAVTAADIKAAFARHVRADKLITVTVAAD